MDTMAKNTPISRKRTLSTALFLGFVAVPAYSLFRPIVDIYLQKCAGKIINS